MNDKTRRLDRELKRLLGGSFNYNEPITKGTVTSVNTKTVDVLLEGMTDIIFDVPVIVPPDYTGTAGLSRGDSVVIIFMNGQLEYPHVLGKIATSLGD